MDVTREQEARNYGDGRMNYLPGRPSDAGPLQPDCPSCGAIPARWKTIGLCVREHRKVCDCCPDVMVGNAGLLCPACLVEMAAEGLRTEQRVHDVETGAAL